MMIVQEKIDLLRRTIDEVDAIVVGGASGMSAASGFVFYYQEDEVFRLIAGSLAQKYNRPNMFDLFYDHRLTRGEYWALVLRTVRYIYECYTGETYSDLAELIQNKNYYIVTTNQDAQFFRVFPSDRITRIQGDWRYWQCTRPCHDQVYYNENDVFHLIDKIEGDALPEQFIPRCPHCGDELAPWVRGYTFLEGEYYRKEMQRYMDFLQQHARRRTLFLELGVGMMTPMFIKEPFVNMVYQWPQAFYVTINPQHAIIPKEIATRSLALKDDIACVMKRLLGKPIGDTQTKKTTEIFNPSRIY